MLACHRRGTKALLGFMLLIISGCSASVQSADRQANSAPNQCPDKPKGSLTNNDVKSVWLGSQSVKESGMVSPGRHLGYSFKAKSGQILSYRTNANICTWVYTPDNQILSSTKLTEDGRYTMQVSALIGSTTFEIEMSLEEPVEVSQSTRYQPLPKNSSTLPNYQHFSSSDFPKSSCGDPLPSDPNDYPVNFYPIFVPYSEANLEKARSLFCQDSLKVRRKDSQELAIQISSFTNEETSKKFADFVSSEISDTEVGQPTIVHYK